MTLMEIRTELSHRINSNETDYSLHGADILADKVAEIVRSVIVNYLEGKMVKE
jgi:hypothetical protein